MKYRYDTEKFPTKGFTDEVQIGWIADVVAKVAPELVGVDKDGYYTVAYARAVALIAEATKELRAEKDKEISALKNSIDQLRQDFRDLQQKLLHS